MKKIIFISSLAIIALVFWSFSNYPEAQSGETKSEETIQWMSFEEALAQSKKDRANVNAKSKKVFIDVYTDWCGWCKVMDKKTFQKEEVAKYINEHFYPVKLDAEQKADIVFQGKTFKYVASGQRGYHELAAALLKGKLSFPTVVFLDEEFRLIQPIAGFLPPENFKPIMRYIGGDHFKNTPWEQFQESEEAKK